MPTRAPSKGEGVPREARGGTFVTELARALAAFASAEAVSEAANARGFYESALMQQQRILSGAAAPVRTPVEARPELILTPSLKLLPPDQ